MPTNTKHLDPVRLTTEEAILVASILRQRAAFCAELGRRAYGRKPYREGLRRKAEVLQRLADAFNTHTVVTLTK